MTKQNAATTSDEERAKNVGEKAERENKCEALPCENNEDTKGEMRETTKRRGPASDG